MKARRKVWDAIYAHDHRGHRHRCKRCNKIINAGEPVVMGRVGPLSKWGRRTWALHADCAALRHSEAYTWREVFEVWAGDRAEQKVAA